MLAWSQDKWSHEWRETTRGESKWVRAQLVSLESELDAQTSEAEGLRAQLTLAAEAAATKAAAQQAQIGRVREREARKGRALESAVVRALATERQRRLLRMLLRQWAQLGLERRSADSLAQREAEKLAMMEALNGSMSKIREQQRQLESLEAFEQRQEQLSSGSDSRSGLDLALSDGAG